MLASSNIFYVNLLADSYLKYVYLDQTVIALYLIAFDYHALTVEFKGIFMTEPSVTLRSDESKT